MYELLHRLEWKLRITRAPGEDIGPGVQRRILDLVVAVGFDMQSTLEEDPFLLHDPIFIICGKESTHNTHVHRPLAFFSGEINQAHRPVPFTHLGTEILYIDLKHKHLLCVRCLYLALFIFLCLPRAPYPLRA